MLLFNSDLPVLHGKEVWACRVRVYECGVKVYMGVPEVCF